MAVIMAAATGKIMFMPMTTTAGVFVMGMLIIVPAAAGRCVMMIMPAAAFAVMAVGRMLFLSVHGIMLMFIVTMFAMTSHRNLRYNNSEFRIKN